MDFTEGAPTAKEGRGPFLKGLHPSLWGVPCPSLSHPREREGKKGKRGIDCRGRKRKQSRRGRREATQEWVTKKTREGRSRADLGQGNIEGGQAEHPRGAPRAGPRGGERKGRAGHVPRDLL